MNIKPTGNHPRSIIGLVAGPMPAWAALLLLAGLGSACTTDNPSYACDTNQDCSATEQCDPNSHVCVSTEPQDGSQQNKNDQDAGINQNDGQAQQDDGQVTQNDGEVAQNDGEVRECQSNDECTDPTKPICDPEGTCRGCASNEECADRDPTTPLCYDNSRCVGTCGNDAIDPGEACDGTNLAGKTCQSETGLSQGILTCKDDCTLDTSNCYQCGNSTAEGPEACDGTNLAGKTCQSETGLSQGTLTCKDDCTFDTSNCYQCGNNTAEGPEACDGSDLAGKTCQSEIGLSQGTLTCKNDCTFDTSDCTNCGDGVCERVEGETSENCQNDCGWVQVSAHGDRTCGLKEDGTVWCWGRALVSMTPPNSEPTRPNGLIDVVDVSVGQDFACAVKSDHSLWCWGLSTHGELGQNDTIAHDNPVQVPMLPAIVEVGAGDNHVCARAENGTFYCWGANDHGQLGDGTTTERHSPTSITLPYTPTQIGQMGKDTSCILGKDTSLMHGGHIMLWGANDQHQAGESNQNNVLAAVGFGLPGMDAVTGPKSVATGFVQSCAVKSAGSLWCWGRGTGTASQVSGLSNVLDVSVSITDNVCVTTSPGTVYCWGYNQYGELGNGTTNGVWTSTPVQVHAIDNGSDITQGERHVCTLTTEGQIWCWGRNHVGQLGNGTINSRQTIPVQVVDPYE
ncbi:MAG: hypothetical protein J7M25_17265 [Deltaproteobacteria bacterium]|nr:hypothetical protein [Deltaproteobacteria bacterium]